MQNKITPNGWFTLWSLYQGIGYPGYINNGIEAMKLEKELFITNDFKITGKGLMIIKEAERIISQYKKTIDTTGWDEKIEEYNSLFPKGRREGSSVGYRCNPKELLKPFVWFFEEYSNYTWEDVFTATKRYIEKFETDGNYTYLQNAKYFIKKSDVNKNVVSTLADVVWTIKEGNDVAINDIGFHYFGE